MSDPHGFLSAGARRGTQRAQRGFRSRWLRIGFVELMFVVVVVLAALIMRGALHPGELAAASGTATTPIPSTTAPSSETSSTPTSRTPTRTPMRTPTRTSTTPPGPTSPGPTPAGKVVKATADQVKPSTGSPGTLVDIGGQQLDAVLSVFFGKFDTVVLPGRSAQVIQVRVPKGNVPGTKVPITLETKTGQVPTQLVFAYDPIPPVTPP
jgi:hypothetical protein